MSLKKNGLPRKQNGTKLKRVAVLFYKSSSNIFSFQGTT